MSKHYESTGTIHLKNKEKKEFVLFVPDKNHCVDHQGKKYAVFLSQDSSKDAKVVSFKKCLNSVKVKLNNSEMNTALLDAAMKQSKVDVIVECEADSKKLKLKLIGITVPTQPVK